MTQRPFPPKPARIALSLLLLLTLAFVGTATAKERRSAKAKKPAAKAQSARNAKNSRQTAKSARNDKRGRGREKATARNGRQRDLREARVDKRRGRNSARELRASRKEVAVDRRGRPLSKRARLAESRRQAAQRRRELAEARRRAEIARQAAIARQRAIEQAMREEAMANIAKDDVTGEDLEVRRAAVTALGNHAGTVVVMNPKTGRVYTIVNQEWALRRGFKPCSTIKLVTGLAGLTEKVIDPVQTVQVSDRRYAIDLTDSLAYSNNGYFQNVGGQVGFERIINYARELGLGQKTGINHANESPGRVPLFKSGFALNRMCSHGDDFEVTPVQLANLVSAIGNGGKLLVPHLPRTPQEDARFQTVVNRKLNIPQEALKQMIPGMIGAVNYGSGRKAFDPLQTIAGKTGTCIGRDRQWLGLFTSYAPVQNPELAVVVIAKGSDGRRHLPAHIAGQIYKSLRHRFGPSQSGMPYASIPVPTGPKINANAAAALSDEDKEDESAELGDDATPETAPGTNSNGVKSTVLTAPRVPATQPSTSPAGKQPATSDERQRPRRVHSTQP